jgi:hypothetical protein
MHIYNFQYFKRPLAPAALTALPNLFAALLPFFLIFLSPAGRLAIALYNDYVASYVGYITVLASGNGGGPSSITLFT